MVNGSFAHKDGTNEIKQDNKKREIDRNKK